MVNLESFDRQASFRRSLPMFRFVLRAYRPWDELQEGSSNEEILSIADESQSDPPQPAPNQLPEEYRRVPA